MQTSSISPTIYDRQVDIFLKVIASQWPSFKPECRILDLGCGQGEMVRILRQHGYLAWGSDINLQAMTPEEYFLATDIDSGKIAIEDHYFDVVISNQVLEHAMDLVGLLQEIRRILRPGGVSFHLFPSRWNLIEPHVFVPFAGVFRPRWYLKIWAYLGIRNRFQTGYKAEKVVSINENFLRSQTNYPPYRRLCRMIETVFPNYKFIELIYLQSYLQACGKSRWKRLVLKMLLSLRMVGFVRFFRTRALWLEM